MYKLSAAVKSYRRSAGFDLFNASARIRSQVLADLEYGFCFFCRTDGTGNSGRGQCLRLLLAQEALDFKLQFDNRSSGFLSRLYARLMIRVDINERRIKSDRAFE